jgi:hypothetical protein
MLSLHDPIIVAIITVAIHVVIAIGNARAMFSTMMDVVRREMETDNKLHAMHEAILLVKIGALDEASELLREHDMILKVRERT